MQCENDWTQNMNREPLTCAHLGCDDRHKDALIFHLELALHCNTKRLLAGVGHQATLTNQVFLSQKTQATTKLTGLA